MPRRNHKSGSNSNAVANGAIFTPRNKTKGCYAAPGSGRTRQGRKKEANKGRSRLPWRLRGTFEGHCSFIGRNVLVPRRLPPLHHHFCADFVFLLGTRYGRPVCCRKKAGPPCTPPLPRPPPSSAPPRRSRRVSVLLLTFSVRVLPRRTRNERTNDQRNVNRKPREATLINPTEINCSAQRRSSRPLARSPNPFLFSFTRTNSIALGRSHEKNLGAVLKFLIAALRRSPRETERHGKLLSSSGAPLRNVNEYVR